jgi:hypothetical protein
MPDFLHEESKEVIQGPVPERSSDLQPAMPPTGGVAEKDGSSRAKAPVKSGTRQKGVGHEKRKTPPPIFTHYYGAFFLFIVAAFLGAGYFFLVPRYSFMTTISAETKSVAATLEEEQRYLDALNRSITSAEAIPKDVLGRVDEALPDNDAGIPKLLVTMSSIAKQSNVKLGSIQFSPGAPSPSTDPVAKLVLVPTKITTTVTTNGYQAMRTYLTNLEQSLRLIDVDSITVSASNASKKTDTGATGGEEVESQYSYALALTAYSIGKIPRAPRQPAEAASPASTVTASETNP